MVGPSGDLAVARRRGVVTSGAGSSRKHMTDVEQVKTIDWSRASSPVYALIEWVSGVAHRDLRGPSSTPRPEREVWTWTGQNQNVEWVRRRMAQETAVHRWDAAHVVGQPDDIDALGGPRTASTSPDSTSPTPRGSTATSGPQRCSGTAPTRAGDMVPISSLTFRRHRLSPVSTRRATWATPRQGQRSAPVGLWRPGRTPASGSTSGRGRRQ